MNEGDRFGRLIIINKHTETVRYNGRRPYCLARCDCGTIKEIQRQSINIGGTRSCGCLSTERKTKHGKFGTPVYITWVKMRQRCDNQNNEKYHRYGGRGIKYQDSWNNFESFFNDMGERPDGKTLDRTNNNGNYTKENCRWSSPFEQSNNMERNIFLTFDNKTMTISKWAIKLNVKKSTLYGRMLKGWSDEKILTYRKV